MASHTLHDYERFEALLHDFGRHIKKFCVRRAGSADEASDLAQEVAMAVWESIGDLRADSTPWQLNRWLRRVMQSAVSDYFRHRRVSTVPIEEASDIPDLPRVDNELLNALLQHLDEEERRLMDERLAGYGVAELAERHEVSPNAMSQRFCRMIQKLRQIYNDEYGGQ